MFRRAVGSLLARRFSPRALPRATPRAAPARSLHSLRDLPIGEGLLNASIFAAGALAGYGGGAFALRHSKKGTAARKVTGARKELTDNKVKFKKPDMKAKFERWIVENDKTYRDEEEKAMRFQLFKVAVERMESQRPSAQESLLPEVSYFADFTKEEKRKMLAHPDGNDRIEYNEMVKSAWAKQEKGEPLMRSQTQVSA